jgi:hypothetical protein
MLTDVRDQIAVDMIRKEYVVFPLRSTKDLNREYPELREYKEFEGLNNGELVFVWAWSCKSSPFLELPEEKRLEPCIEWAFKTPQQREVKMKDYANMRFPDHIKAAIRKMEKFNPGLRIQMAADNLHLLKQCQMAIRQDITSATPDEVEDYMKTATLARKLMADIQKDIEGGNKGVEEVGNTMLMNLQGASAAFHKSQV